MGVISILKKITFCAIITLCFQDSMVFGYQLFGSVVW